MDVFLHTLRVFRFPPLLPWCIYASHNARTGCPWYKVTQKCESEVQSVTKWRTFTLKCLKPNGM